jgi:hypothetical protein
MATLAFETMAPRTIGAFKRAATIAGLPLPEYARRRFAGEKRCPTCKEWKPLDAFTTKASSWDGCGANCRACHVENCRATNERRKNGERVSRRAAPKRRTHCGVDAADASILTYRTERAMRANRLAPIMADAAVEYRRHLADLEQHQRGGRPRKRTSA